MASDADLLLGDPGRPVIIRRHALDVQPDVPALGLHVDGLRPSPEWTPAHVLRAGLRRTSGADGVPAPFPGPVRVFSVLDRSYQPPIGVEAQLDADCPQVRPPGSGVEFPGPAAEVPPVPPDGSTRAFVHRFSLILRLKGSFTGSGVNNSPSISRSWSLRPWFLACRTRRIPTAIRTPPSLAEGTLRGTG